MGNSVDGFEMFDLGDSGPGVFSGTIIGFAFGFAFDIVVVGFVIGMEGLEKVEVEELNELTGKKDDLFLHVVMEDVVVAGVGIGDFNDEEEYAELDMVPFEF